MRKKSFKGLSCINQVKRNIMNPKTNEGKSHRCPEGKLEKHQVAFESKQSEIKTKQNKKHLTIFSVEFYYGKESLKVLK